jgi:alpha 1,3-glucosidase
LSLDFFGNFSQAVLIFLNWCVLFFSLHRQESQASAGFFSYLAGGSQDAGSDAAAATSTETHWVSESGMLDFYLFLGPKIEDVYRPYFGLTGFPALPQEFAVAYHQCRWNYNDQDDVATVDATFDETDIPYDVLWLDIEHTDGKR